MGGGVGGGVGGARGGKLLELVEEPGGSCGIGEEGPALMLKLRERRGCCGAVKMEGGVLLEVGVAGLREDGCRDLKEQQ